MGWLMGLEPTTTGIAILAPDRISMRVAAELVGIFLGILDPFLLGLRGFIPTNLTQTILAGNCVPTTRRHMSPPTLNTTQLLPQIRAKVWRRRNRVTESRHSVSNIIRANNGPHTASALTRAMLATAAPCEQESKPTLFRRPTRTPVDSFRAGSVRACQESCRVGLVWDG